MVKLKRRLTVSEWLFGCATGLVAGVLLMLLLIGGRACGADASDDATKRKVAVALAIAEAEAASRKASAVSVAPQPRPVTQKDYASGYAQSVLEGQPLVVFVSCKGHAVTGAIVSHTDAAEFAGIAGPAVVIAYPIGDRLYVDADGKMKCPVEAAVLQKVVDATAKKIAAKGPVKVMPPAPTPLDWQIRDTAGPVIVGYTSTRVCVGGVCRIVQTPVYR